MRTPLATCLSLLLGVAVSAAAANANPYSLEVSLERNLRQPPPESVQPPLIPGLPPESMQPPVLPTTPSPGIAFAPSFDPALFAAFQQAGGIAIGITRAETQTTASSDLVNALQTSNNVSNVNAQQRSPVSYDPHIRGYRIGQIYTQADGAFYFPARNDLDTVLSKIDPSLIQTVTIIPGPYGLRYGPGFAFIDVQTSDTPRYANGFETHGRTGFDWRTNGGQIYGRETIWGGSSDWGYIFTYGGRNGGDYHAGDGTRIPASYLVHNFSLQLGFDISSDSRFEVRGSRLEQGNTEYALQFFDIDFLATDAVTMNYTHGAPLVGDRLRADAWWNNTRFKGSTLNSGKQTFGPINRVDAALQFPVVGVGIPGGALTGDTSGDYMSTGAREVLTFGNQNDGDMQVDVGVDARYLTQSLVEHFAIGATALPGANPATAVDNQPLSSMFDMGAFCDITLPLLPELTTTLGYRLDYVHTDARGSQLIIPSSVLGAPEGLPHEDLLNTFYLMNVLGLTDVWSLQVGAGYAERVPTLTDRYADNLFLGIIQSGLSKVIGNPGLDEEKLFQVDVGVSADWNVARAEVTAFYSWIHDYVTYQANLIRDATGARILRTLNTDLAVLKGISVKLEGDWTAQITSYATLQYVQGDDMSIAQPLAQIYPLDSRAGLRFKSSDEGQTWGLDMGVRMVATQRLTASFRSIQDPSVLVPVEERTGGFTIGYIRGYYNVKQNLNFVGGVENLFNRNYLDHLALRLPAQANGGFPAIGALSPGITPYLGIEWTY